MPSREGQKTWRSYLPKGQVYFPKFVCINNPRLAILYYVILIIVMGIAVFQAMTQQTYMGFNSVHAQVYIKSWKLMRQLQDIRDAAAADMARPFCRNPSSFDYEYGDVSYKGMTCAPICGSAGAGTCVTPGELYHVDYGKTLFIPTLFHDETFDMTTGMYNKSNHFMPAVDGSLVAFSHQYAVEQASTRILELPSDEMGHSSDTSIDPKSQVLTVLLDREGKEARSWEPGKTISLTLLELLDNAMLIESSGDISALSLDTPYIRVDEDILDDIGDRGVTVRVSGASVYIHLEYTNGGTCKSPTGTSSTIQTGSHPGKLCCMTIKAVRHFVSRRVDAVVDYVGNTKTRMYNGIQIEFKTTGSVANMDFAKLLYAVTTLLIWYQIPGSIILAFITIMLGKLSEIYSRVIYQSMSIKETLTGLGTRLIGHSSAYLDMAESRTEGISRSRMIERFRFIFQDSEELDDDEVVRLVDFIHQALTGQSPDAETQRKVDIEHFCLAATSNEPLSFKSLVHILDKDRSLGPIENLFNDEAIIAIRDENLEDDEEEFATDEKKTTDHSQLDWVSRTLGKQRARYTRLTEKVNKTLEAAGQTLSREADSLFMHRRDELSGMGSPELRPPVWMANGAKYHGEWVGSTRHGYGTETWPDGTTYEGQWAAGRLHGHAVYRQPNSAKYTGQWVNGRQHGQGMHVSESGARYEGQFQHGLKNGSGKIYLVDGSFYEGEVVDNNMHGPGYYEWMDGKSYNGEWVNNLMHGEGTYTFNDGCEYTGQYRDNEKHGRGVFKWPDGKRYEGHYANNKRSGDGVFVMPDGTKIIGTWKDGKQDGPGRVISPGGKEQAAKWDMGILVQS